MIRIDLDFSYENKEYKLFGLFKNDLSFSKSKNNPVSWIDDDFGDPRRWSFTFENVAPEFNVEVVCYRSCDSNEKRPDPEYVILWDCGKDVILAEFEVASSGWKYL